MGKILYLIDTLEVGGAERSLVEMVARLDRERFEPVVCHVYAGDALRAEFENAGVRVVSLGNEGKYRLLRGARRLARVIQEEQPAIVHTTLFRADQIGRLAGRMTKTPVVSSFVNTSYEPVRLADNPHLSRWKLETLRRCDAFTARWVNRFHAVSEAVKESNCRRLGIAPDRVTVVPRGRDPQDFEIDVVKRDALRSELAPGADPLLLNVGRLIDQKGQRYLIEAMPAIVKQYPNAHLLIVGDGWKRGDLEEIARDSGVGSQVTFLGSRDDVPTLLAAADLFVFPSLFEGMPGSLIEAMLAGKPIVASDIEPNREVLEDNVSGSLVPMRSAEAIADAVLELAASEDRRKELGEAARSAACQRYDIDQVVRQMEHFYSEVIENHGEHGGHGV